MDILFSAVVFIFVISVMILVHEWGHYIAARKVGVTVEAFSIGFGPKLFGWTRDGVEFKVSLLPLGGYVKMVGESPDENPTGDPGEFQSRKRWERFIILFMGPLLNILLAYFIWMGILMIGEQKEEWLTQVPVVEYVTQGGPADRAGIKKGDTILAVNDEKMESWEEFVYRVATSPREEIIVSLERNSEQIDFILTPFEDPVNGIGSIGVSPGYPAVIDGVTKGFPSYEIGLENGDVVTEINGKKSETYYDIFDEVSRRTQRAYALKNFSSVSPMLSAWNKILDQTHGVDMTVQREGQTLQFFVSPEFDAKNGIKRLGIVRPSLAMVTVHYSPLDAIVGAAGRCVDMTVRLYDIVAKMFSGKLSSKAISGPLEIAAISGQTALQGLIPLLNLMAFISLNLGIVNLLPLPVLDGGQITILSMEGILRRDLSQNVKEWIMRIGVVMLLMLMVLVISQDIGKLISRMG